MVGGEEVEGEEEKWTSSSALRCSAGQGDVEWRSPASCITSVTLTFEIAASLSLTPPLPSSSAFEQRERCFYSMSAWNFGREEGGNQYGWDDEPGWNFNALDDDNDDW